MTDKDLAFAEGDAFAEMERLSAEGVQYSVVACDPPAFVKTKKDLGAGARGYRKLVRLASTSSFAAYR